MIEINAKTYEEGAGIALPSTASDFHHDRPSSDVEGGDLSSARASFSSAENPYLYPLSLLDSGAQFLDGERLLSCGYPDNDISSNGSSDSDSSAGYVSESNASGSNASGSNVGLSSEHDRPSWWLLHTKPRQEKKLAELLQRFEIPHYLPVTKHRAVTRGRTRITLSPLFSGYFFLLGTPEQRIKALETNRIVATHRVDDGVVLCQRLYELAELIQMGVPLTAEARLAAGRRVRVKAGSFKNMEGTVIKRAGKTRLFIFVNELLGGVSLAIEEHFIEPIF